MAEHVLVLGRHGQSEGNRRNVFTGWMDVPLTEQGVSEAKAAGNKLKELGMRFDAAFTSGLQRAATTCKLALEELGQSELPVVASAALNERDYGGLSGLNKDESRVKWGEEQVHVWRRAYDIPPPVGEEFKGESLKDTVARVLPYYVYEILPVVMANGATLVVAHGNSLRSLIMALEGHTPESIVKVELATGELRRYVLDDCARVVRSESFVVA